jgi:hypothetical protein
VLDRFLRDCRDRLKDLILKIKKPVATLSLDDLDGGPSFSLGTCFG